MQKLNLNIYEHALTGIPKSNSDELRFLNIPILP
jgi:hypothetical protein